VFIELASADCIEINFVNSPARP